MVKWNIYFIFRGAGGTLEIPNKYNPVECINLQLVLASLIDKLSCIPNLETSTNTSDFSVGVELIGIRIEKNDS